MSIRLSLIVATVAMIVSRHAAVDADQHWKWLKPFNWDGPPKYLHSAVYKPQSYSLSHEKPYSSPVNVHEKPFPLPVNHEKPYPPPPGHQKPFKHDHCELRKVVFTQGAESPQYVAYKAKIPDLKEFTLCHWHNIFNYTHDQPIFSYSQPGGKHRAIFSWIENSPEKTYYSLAVNGHTIYRINYPEKLFKWYHVCQSWNGHTGEWQLWINAERVGRGFYNLMVGKTIKGGGVAISGREYLEQKLAVYYASFSGELTLVTLYKAALTAGKAYNDHKHHHVHNFHHGYDESVDEADTQEPPTAAPGPDPTPPPHLAHGGQFSNGQLLPRLPVNGPKEQAPRDEQSLFDGGLYDFYAPFRDDGSSSSSSAAAAAAAAGVADDTFRVNLLDRRDGLRYKRNVTATGHPRGLRSRRWTPVAMAAPVRNARSGHTNDRKREPAEWEVMKVASVCSACETDPFGSASVLSWQDTRKQFFNGALYLPALPKCYLF